MDKRRSMCRPAVFRRETSIGGHVRSVKDDHGRCARLPEVPEVDLLARCVVKVARARRVPGNRTREISDAGAVESSFRAQNSSEIRSRPDGNAVPSNEYASYECRL